MTNQEANINVFKKEARKVFILGCPWLPAGQSIGVDPDKYTDFKNSLADRIFAINAPDIDEKAKLDVVASLQDDLDFMIRWNHKEKK